MAQKAGDKVKLTTLGHIGIVVKDLDKTVEFYSSTFGLGPFEVAERFMPKTTEQGWFRGQEGVAERGRFWGNLPANTRVKLATTWVGEVELELLQVLEGECPLTEFLRDKGEGVHHICFEVTDFDNKMTQLTRQGIKSILGGKVRISGTQINFAYLDANKIGGVVFEIREKTPAKA